MIQASDSQLERVQASAFTGRTELRPQSVLREALTGLSHVYDGETMSIPLPEDVPPGVVSVTLTSRDRAQQIEVSRNRVNVIWLPRLSPSPPLTDMLTTMASRLAMVIKEEKIGRVGMIVARAKRVEDPGIELSRQFAQDRWLERPLNRPEGFELHAHKKFLLLPNLTVNSWMRVRTAKSGPAEYDHVLVEQDINTLTEEQDERQFEATDLQEIATRTAEEFDSILGVYFPSSAAS